ncbi:MAG: class I SAM-dependent methyltransferase [Anaerolineae bacterium]|nr:class I SAM-dependent methyltransferase [Anaerolineae bacterium]
MIGRFIAGKFRDPTGVFGRMAGAMMARGNKTEQEWTIALLDIRPDDHILEIGFGPGVAISLAAEKAVRGHVSGIDASETMRRVAGRRNAAAIRSGLVDLRHAEVSSLPYPDAAFDKAFAVHCIYFWPRPVEALQEVRRVLKPGGSLAVTIMPKDKWPPQRLPPSDLYTLYSGLEVARLLTTAGYEKVRVEGCPYPDQFPGQCVLGSR